MKELFSGERDLFSGLWIDGSDYDFKKYPVIRIDMSQVDTTNVGVLEDGILNELRKIAVAEGLELQGNVPATAFTGLIESMHRKMGERVVVLIDEYDKPIIDHLGNPDAAEKNREAIGHFYGVLKGQDANLRFVFLTGVSKFTKISLFSKLNNLTDLTLWDRYAGICGFTEMEFDRLFKEHIGAYKESRKAENGIDGEKDIAEIKRDIFDWYDGYSWDGRTRVFNSFVTGIRTALDDKDIDKIEDCLRGLYASVPYQLHIAAEAFYQVIFLATMQFLGFRVLGEVSASEGRLDGSIDLINGKSYVIEFKYSKIVDDNKCDDKELVNIMEKDIADAFNQIDERGYSDRYAGTSREVIKLAIAVAGRGKVKAEASIGMKKTFS
jgi:hypothetical protein